MDYFLCYVAGFITPIALVCIVGLLASPSIEPDHHLQDE
jgi:hypothetical protein